MESLSILDIKERLNKNLSGNQIASMMDELLFNAIYPILMTTNLVDRCLGSVLIQAYSDRRRKISSVPKEKLIQLLIKFLVTTKINVKKKIIKKMKLERTIWTNIIESFLEKTKNYLEYEELVIKEKDILKKSAIYENMNKVEKELETSRKYLSSVVKWVKHYHFLYLDFKSMITEKYIRLAYLESVRSKKGTQLHIDINDLFENLLLSIISQALDKYDPKKGALTSFIQRWFMNAKTNPSFDHQYNTSFSVSNSGRRKITSKIATGESGESNLAFDLEDVKEKDDGFNSLEDKIINDNYKEHVVKIISKMPLSIAPIVLGIPFQLTKWEKENFEKSVKVINDNSEIVDKKTTL